MKIDIVVPSSGESVTEAQIAKWVKQPGDLVQLDDVILELETDKATLEINAEATGKLNINSKEGEMVQVGQVIGFIDTASTFNVDKKPTTLDGLKAANNSSDHKATIVEIVERTIDITVPEAGESVTEANISKWYKKTGDNVTMDEVLLELETDKASMEIVAEEAGELEIKVTEGLVKVGDVIGAIIVKKISESPSFAADGKKDLSPVNPSPSRELSLEAKKKSNSKNNPPLTEKANHAQLKSERIEERKPMTMLRKTIANRLVEAQQTAAMLTTFNEINMSSVVNIRKEYKEKFKEQHAVGLGFMSFFTKAVCSALKTWPIINAFIDNQDIVYHQYCDIGIAVSTPKGLVVPVIRNAESMNFHQIESAILELAKKGRDKKLSTDDMTGGTFTITNGGVFGSMLSTPILNKPQSAILGMHNIVNRPIAVGNKVEIHPMMYLALTYDHRLIDGSEAVQFLVHIKNCIEDPHRILLEV